MALKSRTEQSNLNDALKSMPQADIDTLNAMISMMEKHDEATRNCIVSMLMEKATDTHTEELSIGASILINKIIVHYNGDKGVLEAVIQGIRNGIEVGSAERASRAGLPNSFNA